MTHAVRVVQRNAVVYRHIWRGSLFSSFLQPTLYLMALGFGVGSLIDPRRIAAIPGGGYLEFLAPGLLAAACMQVASFESSWPVLGKIVWRRNYEAMLATPLEVDDLIVGELLWVGIRLTTVATAFVLVAAVFGAMHITITTLVAVLLAVLTGLAFSAPIFAYAATLKSSDNFNVLFRFVITPLFMFSGIFVPVNRLPPALQWIAEVSPLYHGVQLVRGFAPGPLDPFVAMMHLGVLLAVFTTGLLVARYTLRRKLYA
jgi:lipooligosaccharide transport system permease protein